MVQFVYILKGPLAQGPSSLVLFCIANYLISILLLVPFTQST